MKTLLHPAYFPNIATFASLVQKEIIWEVEDNYQKQTYRNRCHICTDRGLHILSIPIKHVGGNEGRQKYKDVKLDNSYRWQRQHWRTLQTAYRTSPYFEFYEDELAPLFEGKHLFLLDFGLMTTEAICNSLQFGMPFERTIKYQKNHEPGGTEMVEERNSKPEMIRDARFLVNAKKEVNFDQEAYTQIFGDRHGFIKNVSILDLLFNEGPNSVSYLKSQKLTFLDA